MCIKRERACMHVYTKDTHTRTHIRKQIHMEKLPSPEISWLLIATSGLLQLVVRTSRQHSTRTRGHTHTLPRGSYVFCYAKNKERQSCAATHINCRRERESHIHAQTHTPSSETLRSSSYLFSPLSASNSDGLAWVNMEGLW